MRTAAYKLKIEDLNNGKFVTSPDGTRPSYFVTPWGEEIVRGRILGTVVEKYVREDRGYATVRIDDGTGTIRVKAWRDAVRDLENLNVGDVVDVIGRVGEFEGEVYLGLELLSKVNDPNWELVRDLEIIKKKLEALRRGVRPAVEQRLEPGKLEIAQKPQVLPEAVDKDFPSLEVPEEIKEKVMTTVKEALADNGISTAEIAASTGISLKEAEDATRRLLVEGKIFEPVAGKFKSLE
ncbi:MAG: OB-fold nucleic acid binding domain-containing protein [Candidatus Hadarchaeales archaeon]